MADERDISLSQARQLADKYRSQIAMGVDPQGKKTSSPPGPHILRVHRTALHALREGLQALLDLGRFLPKKPVAAYFRQEAPGRDHQT
ncbi:hypothetical protein [Ferrovum myxofaciens]|uniref:hypothetical protein n=1 Tax=Ferrovum myxofaciens TaxID=416213 RepID=UPI003EB86CDF